MIKGAHIFYEVIIKNQILSNKFIKNNPKSFAISFALDNFLRYFN